MTRVRCTDCGAESFASVDALCTVCRGKLRNRIAALEAEVERLGHQVCDLRDGWDGVIEDQRRYQLKILGLNADNGDLKAEVERLRGVLKAARAWMIGVNNRAGAVHSGTSRVLEDLNIALEPSP